jgi:hypothetical protein
VVLFAVLSAAFTLNGTAQAPAYDRSGPWPRSTTCRCGRVDDIAIFHREDPTFPVAIVCLYRQFH